MSDYANKRKVIWRRCLWMNFHWAAAWGDPTWDGLEQLVGVGVLLSPLHPERPLPNKHSHSKLCISKARLLITRDCCKESTEDKLQKQFGYGLLTCKEGLKQNQSGRFLLDRFLDIYEKRSSCWGGKLQTGGFCKPSPIKFPCGDQTWHFASASEWASASVIWILLRDVWKRQSGCLGSHGTSIYSSWYHNNVMVFFRVILLDKGKPPFWWVAFPKYFSLHKLGSPHCPQEARDLKLKSGGATKSSGWISNHVVGNPPIVAAYKYKADLQKVE